MPVRKRSTSRADGVWVHEPGMILAIEHDELSAGNVVSEVFGFREREDSLVAPVQNKRGGLHRRQNVADVEIAVHSR